MAHLQCVETSAALHREHLPVIDFVYAALTRVTCAMCYAQVMGIMILLFDDFMARVPARS